MAFRAHSLCTVEHPAQNRVQRKAAKALKRSKLMERLTDLENDLTPFVAAQTGMDTQAARKQAKRWLLEAVAEYVYMSAGDVVFIENS
jgi:post-segregation antitoxin (ccd killing protein)